MRGVRRIGLVLGLGLTLAPAAIAADQAVSAAGEAAIGYICSAEKGPAASGARRLVMVKGVGVGGFAIATRSPAAQAWFDYGMQLAHAFYHEDAKLAFKRARDIDPDCAMCAWGEAWADGPTINYDVDAAGRRAATAILARADALAAGETARNRGLIAALKLRYQGDGKAADLAYARALDDLSRAFPDDDEIAILTSDAWIAMGTLHGDRQGQARSVSVLEPVLSRHPDNTGAIHFYIHATEWAGAPGKALPYAERLGDLAPGSSHLVHMASHTFFRVGRYEDAAIANARAIAVDADYLRAAHDGTVQGRVPYHGHNLRFGLAGAIAAGDGPLAVRLADHQAFAFPASAVDPKTSQMSWASAAFAYARFAPARALALADPGPGAPIAAAIRHYARGEVFASRGDAAGTLAEAAIVEASQGAAGSAAADFRRPARAIVQIAALTLRGRAAMIQGRYREAAGFYARAVALQDRDLSYLGAFDPPPWWYPERRSLAAAQLAAGDAAAAARTAREALRTWPAEPLTLQVLGEAEKALGETAGAERDLALSARTWRGGHLAPALI